VSEFVLHWSKLDQNGFLVPSGTDRPPSEVTSMTFVIRINGNEPSTEHTIQLAEELEHGEALWVRLR